MSGTYGKILVAYSGGLDTSVIVPWLKENYGCEVVTYTANLGQGDDELEGLERKALASGAAKAYVVDLREEFLTDCALPTMQSGAIYEALRAFVAKTQGRVTGSVKVKLYKGNCSVVGRQSPLSLYREEFATFGQDDVYDQSDAEGFINLFGLPLMVKALVDMENGTTADLAKPDYARFKRD